MTRSMPDPPLDPPDEGDEPEHCRDVQFGCGYDLNGWTECHCHCSECLAVYKAYTEFDAADDRGKEKRA